MNICELFEEGMLGWDASAEMLGWDVTAITFIP
jgi:hypothetical protein